MLELGVDVGGGLRLKNPILGASGTFGYGVELLPFFDPSRLGGVVGKTITRAPREGNDAPRMWETPAGMLNSIGLQNPGLEAFLERLLPEMQRHGMQVVANVAGESAEDFAQLTAEVSRRGRPIAIELNLSCPNVAHGLDMARDPGACEAVVAACRAQTELPLWAKLSPNVGDLTPIAQAAERGGADALTVGNTLVGLAVDWRTGKARLARGAGGLSGPAIRPVALRMARVAVEAVSIPVIGCGGIVGVDDVLEFLCVGCKAVQVGTATFRDPAAAAELLEALPRTLEEAGVTDLGAFIGSYGR